MALTPEERKEFDKMSQELEQLRDVYFSNNFLSEKVFRQKIISQDTIFADGNGIQVRSNTNPLGVEIRTGSATTSASIVAEVGTLPAGSIYLSSNGVGEMWVMQTTTWTKVTIP